MGLLARGLAGQRRAAAFSEPFWPELLSAYRSKTGETVTVEKALQTMAVLGCMRVISEDVAQVSRDLFQKREDGGSDVALTNPWREILVRRPNAWQTGFEFFEQLVIHTGLVGRFVAFKNVVGGKPRELIPFEPNRVRIEIDSMDRLHYFLKSATTGEEREFPAESVWHVKGPSWNGWQGLEILKLTREAIGLSMATEEAHALMHANGGQTAGIYSVDGTMDETQYQQLRKWIEQNNVGANRFRPFVLDRNAKFLQTSMTGVDAQHLETRRYQVEEVCRAFRVLPIMIGYADKTATFASSSEMFAAHVKYTLGGWYRRLEESINANLLTRDEWQQGLYFKFLPISLLRGNAKDRGDFYWRMWQMGALNPNQIRAYEELNPYEGGDVYRVPVNTAPADDLTDPANDPSADPPGQKPGGSARRNVGRVLSGKNERRIRDADSLLNDVLAELDEEPKE